MPQNATPAASSSKPAVRESNDLRSTRERGSFASVVQKGRCLLARSSKDSTPSATRPAIMAVVVHFVNDAPMMGVCMVQPSGDDHRNSRPCSTVPMLTPNLTSKSSACQASRPSRSGAH